MVNISSTILVIINSTMLNSVRSEPVEEQPVLRDVVLRQAEDERDEEI